MTGAGRARPALRALRREPALVDDRLAAARLADRPELSAEEARWARAWLVCWQAALVADDRHGLDEPWDIPLSLRRIVVPKGGGDAARRARVVAALVAAGLATASGAGEEGSASRVLRLARALFVEHPAALGVDWPGVVAACAEPAPLLVLRALAELAVSGGGDPLGTFTSVPRRELIEATGYGQKQVRLAVRRLASLGLVEVEGDTGTTARYRLAPRAVGQPWRAASASVASPAVAPAVAAPTPLAAPAPAPAPRDEARGLDVTLGGVAITIAAGSGFEVGPGMVARVELGPDGRPRLVVRPAD